MIKLLFFLLVILTCTGMLIHFFSLKKHMKNVNPEDYFIGSQLILAKAIKEQNVEAVKKLAKETDLNTPAKKNITILFFAYKVAKDGGESKSFEIITALVKSGADAINHEVPDLGSVWGVSLVQPDARFVQALLDGGVDINSPTESNGGDPALFVAAAEKTKKVMQLLISRGANINQKDSLGASLLQETLSGMQLDQTEYLLLQGANPNTLDHIGVSFAWFLKQVFERKDLTPSTTKKLSEIKALAISKGMKWPPESPEIERDRMRSSGITPIVPYGMSK
jgi:uncharacterized protein